VHDQEDDGEREQQVDATGHEVKRYEGDNPARQEDHEQHEKEEISEHRCYLPERIESILRTKNDDALYWNNPAITGGASTD
jgi:hypothetical protein